MRIGSQNVEVVTRSNISPAPAAIVSSTQKSVKSTVEVAKEQVQVQKQQATVREDGKEAISKEQLEKAVTTINEFLDSQHKSSKFVFHDGLNQYYVRLVDAETEEVIKEIPPERLLDAFYEMQKLAGMIVDEKI